MMSNYETKELEAYERYLYKFGKLEICNSQ